MLRAFAVVRGQARLVIAGTGVLELSLRQLATELAIGDRVHFLGFTPDVCRWMQAADGFVLSSLWEGLPMAVLEAAACALPAVGTDVLGTREVIVHDRTGLLAVPGDVEDWAGYASQLWFECVWRLAVRATVRILSMTPSTGQSPD